MNKDNYDTQYIVLAVVVCSCCLISVAQSPGTNPASVPGAQQNTAQATSENSGVTFNTFLKPFLDRANIGYYEADTGILIITSMEAWPYKLYRKDDSVIFYAPFLKRSESYDQNTQLVNEFNTPSRLATAFVEPEGGVSLMSEMKIDGSGLSGEAIIAGANAFKEQILRFLRSALRPEPEINTTSGGPTAPPDRPDQLPQPKQGEVLTYSAFMKPILDEAKLKYEETSDGAFSITASDGLVFSAHNNVKDTSIDLFALFPKLSMSAEQIKRFNDLDASCIANNTEGGGVGAISSLKVKSSGISADDVIAFLNTFPSHMRRLLQVAGQVSSEPIATPNAQAATSAENIPSQAPSQSGGSTLTSILISILDNASIAYEQQDNGTFILTSKEGYKNLLRAEGRRVFMYAAFSGSALTPDQLKLFNNASPDCTASNAADGGCEVMSSLEVSDSTGPEALQAAILKFVNAFPAHMRRLVQVAGRVPAAASQNQDSIAGAPAPKAFEKIYRMGEGAEGAVLTSEEANAFARQAIEAYYNQVSAGGELLAEELFHKFHPQGTAKRLRVHDVQGKWRGELPSARWEDVVSLDVVATIDWSSIRFSEGWTKVGLHWDGQVGHWTKPEMIKVVEGAITNTDVEEKSTEFANKVIDGVYNGSK